MYPKIDIKNEVSKSLVYNDSEFPTIADARAKQWECTKCPETFDNYREATILQ